MVTRVDHWLSSKSSFFRAPYDQPLVEKASCAECREERGAVRLRSMRFSMLAPLVFLLNSYNTPGASLPLQLSKPVRALHATADVAALKPVMCFRSAPALLRTARGTEVVKCKLANDGTSRRPLLSPAMRSPACRVAMLLQPGIAGGGSRPPVDARWLQAHTTPSNLKQTRAASTAMQQKGDRRWLKGGGKRQVDPVRPRRRLPRPTTPVGDARRSEN